MNPLWYLVGALVVVPAAPFTVIAIYQSRKAKHERRLARRAKAKIKL